MVNTDERRRLRNSTINPAIASQEPAALDTRLEGNVATGSGDDGFDVRSPSTVVAHNFAARNHDLGFDAVVGVIDGGGNRAVLNGNPLQCVNVSC